MDFVITKKIKQHICMQRTPIQNQTRIFDNNCVLHRHIVVIVSQYNDNDEFLRFI